jgi:hypothetical protein
MGGGAWRGRVVVVATSLLASAGCRGDEGPGPGAATEEGSSSEGSGLAGSESTGAEPGVCLSGQARACYEGPPGTEGLGMCAAGQQVCADDGQGWSACAGEVWPAPAERCDTPQDDDCDGLSLCDPTLEWWQAIPAYGLRVATGDAGGVVVMGVEQSGKPFESEPGALFLRELDATGQVMWERGGTPPWYQWATTLAVDATGAVVIAGTYEGTPDFGGGSLPQAFGYDAFAVRYTTDGEHAWSHAIDADGYHAAALGPDGTTYLAGSYVYDDVDGSQVQGEIFVVAIDPSGELQWIQTGAGGFATSEGLVALVVTEASELALVVVADGSAIEFAGMPVPIEGWRPLVVRMGLDGSPLGYRPLTETPPVSTGEVRAFARPGGLMAVVSVVQYIDERYFSGLLMVGMDTALEPTSQHLVEGAGVWLRAAALHSDGSTLLSAEFSGLVELGTLGVGVPGSTGGALVTALDDLGEARWVEVLYAESYVDIGSVAAASDGAVYLTGDPYDGGTLDGVAMEGPFVAKLRP